MVMGRLDSTALDSMVLKKVESELKVKENAFVAKNHTTLHIKRAS